MRVAALISGGKDSVLAAHVAQNHGWDVTHVVTVRSRASDSYMFHTPNTNLAPLIAQAMRAPLVVVETRGEKEREVEDLANALSSLDIDGFVSGAIASEYQRTRLEGVGHQLGLKSFAPLWHKEPAAVLRTVAGEGWDVRFAAVAAEGFDASWLGSRLDARAIDKLAALRAKFGVHLAGEGGEFETLVLDAPCYHERIEVTSAEPTWRRDGGNWSVTAARLAPKRVTPPATGL